MEGGDIGQSGLGWAWVSMEYGMPRLESGRPCQGRAYGGGVYMRCLNWTMGGLVDKGKGGAGCPDWA